MDEMIGDNLHKPVGELNTRILMLEFTCFQVTA